MGKKFHVGHATVDIEDEDAIRSLPEDDYVDLLQQTLNLPAKEDAEIPAPEAVDATIEDGTAFVMLPEPGPTDQAGN